MFIFLYLPEVTHDYIYGVILAALYVLFVFLNLKHKISFDKKDLFLSFFPWVFFQCYYLNYSAILKNYDVELYPTVGLDDPLGVMFSFIFYTFVMLSLIYSLKLITWIGGKV